MRKKKEIEVTPVEPQPETAGTIPVIFRYDEGISRQKPDYALFAIFPTIPWETIPVFALVVHSNMVETAASYMGCIYQSREATPEEYEPFLARLKENRLPLEVVKHDATKMRGWYMARIERAAMREEQACQETAS